MSIVESGTLPIGTELPDAPDVLHQVVYAFNHLASLSLPEDTLVHIKTREWWDATCKKISHMKKTRDKGRNDIYGGVAEAVAQTLMTQTMQRFTLPPSLSILEGKDGDTQEIGKAAIRFVGPHNVQFHSSLADAKRDRNRQGEADIVLMDESNMFLVDFTIASHTLAEKAENEVTSMAIVQDILREIDLEISKLHLAVAHTGGDGAIRPLWHRERPIEQCYVAEIDGRDIVFPVIEAAITAWERGRLFAVFRDALGERGL